MGSVNTYMNRQDSRFAELSEILESTKVIDLSSDFIHAGVPVLSDGQKVYVDDSDSNSCIVADPGSGKSRRIAIPLVLSCADGCRSMVVNDPKGEIFKACQAYLCKKGYSVNIINLRDPMYGDAYNPLLHAARLYKRGKRAKAKEEFMQLAETLYSQVHSEKDMFWEIICANLFVAFCIIACELMRSPEKVTIPLIYRLFIEGEKRIGASTVLKEYMYQCDNPIIKESLIGYTNSASETKASILAVFSSVLSRLVINEEINDIISNNTLDVEKLINSPSVLFIIPRDETETYNVLVTTIIDQIYNRLIDEADKNGGVLKRKFEFIIDEFGNLTPLHYVDNKISESRSRNIRWHLFIQSYDQIYHRYKDLAPVIFSCCQNTFFMHSPEDKLLKNISERCGYYVTQYTHERKPLLSVSALQHLNKEDGETLILLNRLHPFVSNLPDCSVYVEKLNLDTSSNYRGKRRKVFRQSQISLEKLVERKKEKHIQELFGPDKIKKEKDVKSETNIGREKKELDSKLAKVNRMTQMIDKKIELLKEEDRRDRDLLKKKFEEQNKTDLIEKNEKSIEKFLDRYFMEQEHKQSITDYLNGLEENRDNAQGLYMIINKYSIMDLYSQLLGRFNKYLSSKESEIVQNKYNKLFDVGDMNKDNMIEKLEFDVDEEDS